MDEFSGRHFTDQDAPPLATGVVCGARSFGIDNLGRLTGVRYMKVWRPGENLAVCLKEGAYASGGLIAPVYVDSNGYPVPAPPAIPAGYPPRTWTFSTKTNRHESIEKPADHKKPEHHMVKCQCGFYAYYEGSNDYASDNTISGVVEGYGECLIGTRGFRAAKARIVALSRPGSFYQNEQVVARIRRNYKDVPFFDTFTEMVKTFPPDQSLELSPDNDPSFWTR